MRSIVVLCLSILALLGACASPGDEHLIDDDMDPTTSVSASPSPSNDIDRQLPIRPAMQQSEPGAEAQVRYALGVIDYAKATGDTKALLELSKEGCVPCADAYDAIQAGKSKSIPTEHTLVGSTSIEGDLARVDTTTAKSNRNEVRTWQLQWSNPGWEFGSIVNSNGQ